MKQLFTFVAGVVSGAVAAVGGLWLVDEYAMRWHRWEARRR